MDKHPTVARAEKIDGKRIHYLTAGQGPAVLLLHGYTQTSRMWRPLTVQQAHHLKSQKVDESVSPDKAVLDSSSVKESEDVALKERLWELEQSNKA